MAVSPVIYGRSDRPPRGDYTQARADYTLVQDWSKYTPAQHQLYLRLYERQATQLHGLAAPEFIDAIKHLGTPEQIPNFEKISQALYRSTKWEIAAVPGLIPEEAFFSLLAQRKFPVTVWLREPEEFDYIVEPDVFHDMFGHVPLLFDPMFADYMQAYGQGGLKASKLGKCEYLARLYWHTVEFGLIKTGDGLRAYGAGILSSAGELKHSVHHPKPNRLGFDLKRIMRTRYAIDSYQSSYFVIDSYKNLMDATAPDFTPIYEEVSKTSHIEIGGREANDIVL